MQQDTKNTGVIAGESTEDVITEATVKSLTSSGKYKKTTASGGQRLGKNKAKSKGTASQRTAPGDVQVASNDAQKSVSNPATKNDLIERIKSMPDKMLPAFIKPYVEIMVNKFGIDTREKAANFLGQISGESIRGLAEYVYYTSETDLRAAFGGKVNKGDVKNFLFDTSNLSNYGFGIPPWSINGLNDVYYGSRTGNMNGNRFNGISIAQNPKQNVKKGEKPNDFHTNPGFYKGSPEGYAYRGHGLIQITGKTQYEKMNEYFGVNGTYEKNNVDFLKNPEMVSEDSKFALLSSLMWWSDHKGVHINKVSLATTKTITTGVRGRSEGYQYRHKNTERYYYYLIHGKDALQDIDVSGLPTPKGFVVGRLKTPGDVSPVLSQAERNSLFGRIEYVPSGGDSILITNNFAQNIKMVDIPQLNKFGGQNRMNGMRFHYKCEQQLQGLWREWEQLGLLDNILSFNGSYVPRFVRGTTGSRRPLSAHAWGTAFDINASYNLLGQTPPFVGQPGSVRLLVKSAIKWGFYWGGWWPGRPDGMHFEVSRLDY